MSESRTLEKVGIDSIVAQSYEVEGHHGTFIGKPTDSFIGGFSLILKLADDINLPVIVAGGIMDARGILSALILDADRVQMGTAFLTCTEVGVLHLEYKNKFIKSVYNDTILTNFFSGRLARGICNKFTRSINSNIAYSLDYLIQNGLTKII